MRFEVKTGHATKLKTACLILPVYSSGALPAATKSVNSKTGGHIADLLADGDIEGKIGDALLVKPPQGHGRDLSADRVLLIGCGERKSFNRKQYRKAIRVAFGVLRKTKLKDAVCFLNAEAAHGTDAYRRARIAVEVWHHGAYRYTTTKPSDESKPAVQKSLGFTAKPSQTAQIRKGIKQGDATGQGMIMTRELGNLPANHCTPSHLVKEARQMAKGNARLSVEVLTEADMKKLGMGALLSVTAGRHGRFTVGDGGHRRARQAHRAEI